MIAETELIADVPRNPARISPKNRFFMIGFINWLMFSYVPIKILNNQKPTFSYILFLLKNVNDNQPI